MKEKLVLFCTLLLFLFFNPGCTYAENNNMETSIEKKQEIVVRKEGKKYQNWLQTKMLEGGMLSATWDWIKGGERTEPEENLPVEKLSGAEFLEKPSQELIFWWLGHSSVLIELNGYRLLIDPVFSTYASPVPGFVKRFADTHLTLEELPKIDAVVISHDHYDHLDKKAVISLSKKGTQFFVPLGVGERLEDWGISSQQIEVLSWWQQASFGNLKLTCVPARHFSGRSLFDSDKTLWAGWVIEGTEKSIFYSGDSGYADHFKLIGDKYGPFDLTMIKIGAYDKSWPDIHVNSEQAVAAHLVLKGKLFLPVHWGTFNLALHAWDEPIIRAVQAAKDKNVSIVTPKIGELVETNLPISTGQWWKNIK